MSKLLLIFQLLLNNTIKYIVLTLAVQGFVYLVPSVLSLSGVSLYFSLLGVAGLASLLLIPTAITSVYGTISENLDNSSVLVFAIILSMLFVPLSFSLQVAVPFFISILFGVSPFIYGSFLSLSALNISLLVSCAYGFVSGVLVLLTVDKTAGIYFDNKMEVQVPSNVTYFGSSDLNNGIRANFFGIKINTGDNGFQNGSGLN